MTKDTIYEPNYTNSWALVIGINAYQKASPLRYACNDAEVVAKILEEIFGFPKKNIKLILNEDATRRQIFNGFFEFAKEEVSPNDRLLVFYAGHGLTKTGIRGEVGFLVPVDGDPDNLSTLIRWDELTMNSELIPAKHILFIMDACYGGLALTRSASPGTMRFAKDMLQRYSRQVLAAGKANETVADSGGPKPGHSIFTGHLLQALEGALPVSDGIITANRVMAYVYDKVSTDHHSQQTPHYGHFDGDGDLIFNASDLEKLSSPSEVDKDVLIEIPPTLISQKEPKEIRTLQETIKSYLSDKKDKIRLDDIVTNEIRRVLDSTGGKDFPVQTANVDSQEFANRLKRYEHIVADLQMMVTLIAKWGTEEHRGVLEKIFSRVSESNIVSEGKVAWLTLRWYPVMILLYSGGVAALSNLNYNNLATMFKAPIRFKHSDSSTHEVILPTVEEILKVMRSDLFKTLPGHERHYVPRSEYIFKVLQPPLEDLLFLGRSYELLFDKFEVLFALVYADLTYEQGNTLSRVWGPPGRFGWKYHSRYPDNPFSKIVTEAAQQKEDWGPVRAGLFQGSYNRFKMIAEKYEELIKRLQWF